RSTTGALRQHQKKIHQNRATLHVAQDQLARCANDRRSNCPHSMNCALRRMHLCVAQDTASEEIVAV
ncbi:hypothetical protein A2U01_0104310, partial [Trifolium medium]|nr:hypothetical protein [Trifolium medium]